MLPYAQVCKGEHRGCSSAYRRRAQFDSPYSRRSGIALCETCQHALDQLIIHSQPTHAVAVFDDDARSSGWRHQRLPDYKAGRPPMPDDLHNEMPALRAAFEQRGVRCWASDGNEADDLAATLALKLPKPDTGQPLCQPIKAIASCSLRDCAFATTSRNAGWTRRLLKKSLAYFPAVAGLLGSGRNQ